MYHRGSAGSSRNSSAHSTPRRARTSTHIQWTAQHYIPSLNWDRQLPIPKLRYIRPIPKLGYINMSLGKIIPACL